MTPVTLLVVVLGFASLLLCWATQACVLRTLGRRKKPREFPPISVLKPLKGADEGLFDNLASIAVQDYPAFEIVVACEEISDPALAVVQRVRAAFPWVAVTTVAGGRPIGCNPKVNNLKQALEVASCEHVLISDADVRVGPGYLRALAAELNDPKVGLVTNPIAGVGEKSLGSTLDNLHLNTFAVGSVCAADTVGHACVIGKSMLFRKGELQRLGGLERVKDVLAEDYVLGQLFQSAGMRVALSPYVVHAVNRRRSVADFWARHVRWGQMRRQLAAGPIYWMEPMLMPSAWLCAALLTVSMSGPSSENTLAHWLLIAALGMKGLTDAMLSKRLRGKWPTALGIVVLPFRDLIGVAMWLCAALRTTVHWRGNYFRIGAGSVLSPLPEKREAEALTVQL